MDTEPSPNDRRTLLILWILCGLLAAVLVRVSIGLGSESAEKVTVIHRPRPLARVVATVPSDSAQRPGDVRMGRRVYRANACNTCHSLDGSVTQGPSFVGVYGSVVTFQDGESRIADENYLRDSILHPHDHIVAGFSSVMPEFSDKLSTQEVEDLIAFIKTRVEPE